ncbi:MATE family efflux transporter [Myxococcota bacterium]|nr:MATE family efflux transporter [Myxococcota bacterium]MBU1535364.1 MATE family efflux transporter [Myxococcota bacterium]
MHDSRSFLGEEPVGKLLLKLTVPATMGMLVGALYNLVDTIFVGRAVGPMGIGAISIVFPFMGIVMACAQTVGMGGASIISRAMGKGDLALAERTLGNLLGVLLLFATLLFVVGQVFLEPILKLFGATRTMLPLSFDYMRIVLFGNFFFTFTMALNNILRAEGKAKESMFVMITGAGLNIILDPIFIFGLNMGIRGAALATAIAQVVAFLFLMSLYLRGKTTLKIRVTNLAPVWKILREVFAVGASVFVRQMAGSLMTIIINNLLKHYGGDIYISIFGVFHRLLMFLFMPMFGIMQGLQPIVGFNYGAKKPARIRAVVRLAAIWATAICLVGTAVLLLFSEQLIGLFNTDPVLIREGSRIIRITVLGIPLVGVNIVATTMVLAFGKALPSLIMSMSRQVLFLMPLVLLLPLKMGLNGIWIAFPLADLAAFFLIMALAAREFKSLKRLDSLSRVLPVEPS